MALVKENRIIADVWQLISNIEDVAENQFVYVSLDDWLETKLTLLSKTSNIGILLKSDERAVDISEDIHKFKLIALDYPTFMDGRAYSTARLLRERFGYQGELRAVGNVLQDQLFYMQRCGFDAFEINAKDEIALNKWLAAQSEMSIFYQPTADGRKTALSLRQLRQLEAKAG